MRCASWRWCTSNADSRNTVGAFPTTKTPTMYRSPPSTQGSSSVCCPGFTDDTSYSCSVGMAPNLANTAANPTSTLNSTLKVAHVERGGRGISAAEVGTRMKYLRATTGVMPTPMRTNRTRSHVLDVTRQCFACVRATTCEHTCRSCVCNGDNAMRKCDTQRRNTFAVRT